jgi:hypothetical protein
MSETDSYWTRIASICAAVTIAGSVFVTCVILLIRGTQYIDQRAANDKAIQRQMAQHTETLAKIGWTQWHSPIYLRISQFDEWIDDAIAANNGIRLVHSKDLQRDQSVPPAEQGQVPTQDQ